MAASDSVGSIMRRATSKARGRLDAGEAAAAPAGSNVVLFPPRPEQKAPEEVRGLQLDLVEYIDQARERERQEGRRERAIAEISRRREPSRDGFSSREEGQYLDLLRETVVHGAYRAGGARGGCFALFGRQLGFDLASGFPLLTTRRLDLKPILQGLLRSLTGDAGPGGAPPDSAGDRRRSRGPSDSLVVDQIKAALAAVRANPAGGQVTASPWRRADMDGAASQSAALFQLAIQNDRLSCQVYEPSAEVLFALPLEIAAHALLTLMIARTAGLMPGELVIALGDAHLHTDHLAQAKEQLRREPRRLPRLCLSRDVRSLAAFRAEDFTLEGYEPHPTIRAEAASL
jgi:thymidylate synthase